MVWSKVPESYEKNFNLFPEDKESIITIMQQHTENIHNSSWEVTSSSHTY